MRELSGVNLIGADIVEVSPPFDPSGGTAFLGVSIMFEILCQLSASRMRKSNEQSDIGVDDLRG